MDLFGSIAKNADVFQHLIKAQAPREIVLKFDEGRILKEFQRDDSVQERYRAIAIVKALTEIAVIWFQNGMVESPEKMAEMMIEIYRR